MRCQRMARVFFLKDRLDKATLERLHLQVGLSYVEIAERFGTRSGNVIKLMDEYGIQRRIKRVRKPAAAASKPQARVLSEQRSEGQT